MKNNISQYMLELYHRGLVTRKERKLVENALATDSEVRKQYEELQKSDKEINQLVTQELNRLNIPSSPPVQFSQKRKIAAGVILAAAVLCVIFSVFIFNKLQSSINESAIAEENKIETKEETLKEIENKTELSLYKDEAEIIKEERTASYDPDMFKTSEPKKAAEPEPQIEPESKTYIAVETPPDTGIRTRGVELSEPQSETVIITDEESNINIPPGMSFIFDNMFANRDLSFVIIPSRIKTISKNAFLGNPLLSVTIGADVSVEDNAIPGNFAAAYNNYGKAGGTYTRSDVNSERWEKK